jgi:hypothetical protein
MFPRWRQVAVAGIVGLALGIGCAPTDTDADTDTGGEGHTPMTTRSKYRAAALELLPLDEGEDLDGDGQPDNNLPRALTAADAALSALDLSPEGFALQIEQAIAEDRLVLLFDVETVDAAATMDLLSGRVEGGGDLVVDEASYDADGAPLTRLVGSVDTSDGLALTTDEALLPVPFLPDEPPAQVPLVQARFAGTRADDALEGRMAGAIPADRLVDDVLADLIPDEGFGNLSREEAIELVRDLASLEIMADVDLGDGERAVSCAFQVTAVPADWDAP